MKKAACLMCLLAFALCSPVYGEVVIDASAFPDETFREYVRSFDIDGDGVLSNSEIASVKVITAGGYISVSYEHNAQGTLIPVYENRYNIRTLKGIEYFTGLQILDCSFNQLETLDVSSFPNLQYLNCANNSISSLDISKNPKLKVLWCCRNKIASLDTSNNPELQELYCWTNQLSALDVSSNTNLQVLFCSDNLISALDISKNLKLWSVSCGRNQIRTLDTSSNTLLTELYCFRNRLGSLNTGSNRALTRLSFTKNNIGTVNIRPNTLLKAFDCGENYLVSLDVKGNTALEELYFYGSTVRNIDLSANAALISLDCSSTNLLSIDVSSNTRLQSMYCYGNSKLEMLHLTSSDGHYQTDLREYVGADIDKVEGVQGYQYVYSGGEEDAVIKVGTSGFPVVTFEPVTETYRYPTYIHGEVQESPYSSMPHFIRYDYRTGSTGSAGVPRTMSVRVSLPLSSFIYLPEYPSSGAAGDLDRASKVVSVDEIADFYPFTAARVSLIDDTAQDTPDTPTPDNPDTPSPTASTGSGGGGGGCNYGLGIMSLVLCGLLFRRKAGLVMLAVLFTASVCYADYVLPIEYTIYDIAGTWTADFELTSELTERIAAEWPDAGISDNKLSASDASPSIHLYTESVIAEDWNVRPQDLYTLSQTGEYGGVILPVISGNTSNDIYVALCTFSNDIQPGELISVHGFQVDTSERESVSDEGKRYLAKFVIFDENYRRVDSVPDSRKVYIAVSLSPEYVNAGIVTVIRGEYVKDDDPLYRLTPEAAQSIADDLGIASSDLKYLTRANIGLPVEPTDAMKDFVKSDDHEIIINLPTVSVDEEGRYVIPITLSDDEFELIRDKSVADFKTYALNDSDLGDGQMKPAFIFGLLNTWEVYTLAGKKMDSFGVQEFLLVGLLNAGKPFSLYLAKMLIMLLMGGCNSGISPSAVSVIIAGILIIKLWKKS
ncbi:MAG: leucine-rich repeat domain-containing protein [Synergistaceae bacterium]|nr:leucine-rich repeat domain-containing protein [Synergistaceae bacterium]